MSDDIDWEMSVDWSKYDQPIIEPVNHAFKSATSPFASPLLSTYSKSRRSHHKDRDSESRSTKYDFSDRVRAPYEGVRPDDSHHTSHHAEGGHHTSSRQHGSSRFRFKEDKHSSKHRHRSHVDGDTDRRRHKRSRREHEYRPAEPETVHPDEQFRESLFQAMADDEGFQFWEGVYGQPIPFERVPANGFLDGMSEDEYAAHLRAEMYKKTHAYQIEQRARREAQRAEEHARREAWRIEDRARREAEAALRRKMMEDQANAARIEQSLRNGRLRQEKARTTAQWSTCWSTYLAAWSTLGKDSRAMPWPVLSGKKADINAEEVKRFISNAPTAGVPASAADMKKALKVERVRWHPDKLQQKLGGQDADKETMKTVTAVFQIVDKLYTSLIT